MLFGEFKRLLACLVIHIAVQHNLRTVMLGALHLDERGGGGHDHDGFCSTAGSCKCHTLRMIARRCGNQTATALFVGQRADFVIGAANFICAGALHVLGLEIHLVAGGFAEMRALDKLGLLGHFFDSD